ncbi:MAG: DUF4446 family protein [Candidatus Chisholmbacteria bacterium]|nr:DUF4446 family protein [Candidatus Chisholmbacteria bacterium]
MALENIPLAVWGGIGGVGLAWLVGVTVVLIKLKSQYRRLTDGVSKQDLMAVLSKLTEKVEETKTGLDQLESQYDQEVKAGQWHLQKMGFVRFNPFTDTGGDQSFCLTLLDGQDNGIMISSLHSRDQTRLYAKRLKAGKSDGVELSREEKRAMTDAQNR